MINDARGQFFYNDIKKVEEIDLSGVEFSDTEVTYNGLAQSLTATNVPENVTVTYEYYQNEEQINQQDVIYAGEYTVVARFRVNVPGKYIKVNSLTAILTINPFVFTDNDYVYESVEMDFDGEEHEHKIASLPAGVGVTYTTYTDTGHTKEASTLLYGGTYYIVAQFYAENPSVIISEEYRVKEVCFTINPINVDFILEGHALSTGDFAYRPFPSEGKSRLYLKYVDLSVYSYTITVSYKVGLLTFACESSQITDFYLIMRSNGQHYILKDGTNYSYTIKIEYRDQNMKDSVKFNDVTGNFVYHTGDFE